MEIELQGEVSGFQGKKDPSKRYFKLLVMGGETFLSVPEKLIPDILEDQLAKMKCKVSIGRSGIRLDLLSWEGLFK